jgi:Flp pilus assembly pilin Flp
MLRVNYLGKGSTFVPWTRQLTSLTIIAAVTAPEKFPGRKYSALVWGRLKTAGNEQQAMFGRLWAKIRGEEGQNVSEYAVLLVLLLLIVVFTVHAIGMNAQQVIDKVNTALHG